MSTTERATVEVCGLARRYAQRTAVEGVTLTARPGDIVGLVGANGGGKTTTLRMLAGLLRPSGGSGTVLGRDVNRPAGAERARTGFMTQALALYPELTVAENLAFRARILTADPDGAVARAIARCGLSGYASTRIDRLSGGWARRAQFAATTLHDPCLLLLDEPTAGLDPRTRQELWRWIAAQADTGATVLVATHDLAEAERCPTILHFRDGTVEGPFPPSQLLARTGAATLEGAVIVEAGG